MGQYGMDKLLADTHCKMLPFASRATAISYLTKTRWTKVMGERLIRDGETHAADC